MILGDPDEPLRIGLQVAVGRWPPPTEIRRPSVQAATQRRAETDVGFNLEHAGQVPSDGSRPVAFDDADATPTGHGAAGRLRAA